MIKIEKQLTNLVNNFATFLVKLSFKTKKLKQSLTTDKGLAKSYGVSAKKAKQRINDLLAAENLWVIAQYPAMRLHPYKGESKGTWSIDIYKNRRILFRIANNPVPTLADGGVALKSVTAICIESVEDPH